MTELEIYLRELDNSSYDHQDIQTINSEFQRLIGKFELEGNSEEAILADLNRQVFSVRKSFNYLDNKFEGTLRGLSWMTSGNKTLKNGTKELFYWPDITAFTQTDFDYFEKRYKESNNLFVKTEYGLMVYFGSKSKYAKNLSFKRQLFSELFKLSMNYLEKSRERDRYIIEFFLVLELAVGIAKESKLEKELEDVVNFTYNTHQNWNTTHEMTLRVLLDLSALMSTNYQVVKKVQGIDFQKVIDKNIEGAKDVEKTYLWGAIYLVDRCLKINQQRGEHENKQLLRYKAELYEKLALEAESKENFAVSEFAERSLRIYQQLRSSTDIERLENYYNTIRSKFGLMKHSLELPPDYYEEIINQIERTVAENDERGILNYFFNTPWYRKIEEINNFSEIAKKQFMLQSIFPVNIVDKFGNTVDVFYTDDEKEKYNFWQNYNFHFQLGTQTMHRFFITSFKSNKLNYDSVLSYLGSTWLNQEIERRYNGETISILPIDTIKPGLKRIFEELDLFFKDETYVCDFVTIIDSLTLKIEGLLRNVCEKIGIATFRTLQKGNNKLVMEKTLDELLADLAHEPESNPDQKTNFDEEDRIMIKFVLSEKAGLNLRNEVAHGLMDVHEYSFELVVILFSLIMKLSNYKFIERNGGE
jgi:hypothetical protein